MNKQTTKQPTTPNRPTFIAYEVSEPAEGERIWKRIGSVFAHKDGKGYNLVLSASPASGRLVLREARPFSA